MPTRLAQQLGLHQDPGPLRLLGEAGFLLSYLGRFDESIDVFNALITLAPGEPVGYLGLADCHLIRSDYPLAEKWAGEAVSAAIERGGANDSDRTVAAHAHVMLAQALLHQDRTDDARQAFGKAREIDPEGPAGQFATDMLTHAAANA